MSEDPSSHQDGRGSKTIYIKRRYDMDWKGYLHLRGGGGVVRLMVQLGVAVKNSMSTDLLTVTTRTAQGKKRKRKGASLGVRRLPCREAARPQKARRAKFDKIINASSPLCHGRGET